MVYPHQLASDYLFISVPSRVPRSKFCSHEKLPVVTHTPSDIIAFRFYSRAQGTRFPKKKRKCVQQKGEWNTNEIEIRIENATLT